MSETYEWCVMHPSYPNEPHRGPMSESDARKWVQEVEEDGAKVGAYYVARRLVGPWLPADHGSPTCWCTTCDEDLFPEPDLLVGRRFTTMIVRPNCANKRCPRATNHRLDCTGSNDPSQQGSRYGGR